jgi:hypothetical protein
MELRCKPNFPQTKTRVVRGWLFLARMSAARDHAEKQPSILGEEVSGQRGAGCVRHTSIAEDGLESHSGVGT